MPDSMAPTSRALATKRDAVKAAIPGGGLFREEAVRAYLRGDAGASVLRVAPAWTRTLFQIASLATVIALVLACVGHIDLTARASGILRAEGGTQTLTAQVAGRIQGVKVVAGDAVQAGDTLVVLDIASAKAALMEATKQRAIAESNAKAFEGAQVAHREEQRKLVTARIRLLGQRAGSELATQRRSEARRRRLSRLQREGLTTATELEDADEQIALASRAASALHEEIAQARTQLSQLSSDVESELQRLRSAVDAARAHEESVAFSLEQSTITAPKSGRVEAVVAQPGDTVSVGTPLVKIVPAGAPIRVVSFLAERDRAFVEQGAEVRLEMEQLPSTEFGALRGRVVHVARDLASSYEIREVLGDKIDASGPVYRIDLELVDDRQSQALGRYLRPSSLLTVRFALRKRRVITLLVEPLRKLFS